jgi:type II secretory pathway component GspD/PulD (secretin)
MHIFYYNLPLSCFFIRLSVGVVVLIFAAAPADLIQPLEPVSVQKKHSEDSSGRIENFLHDCYAHPALKAPFDLSLSATPLKKVIQLLAQAAKLSVVVDDAVSGVVPLLMVRGEPIGSVLHTVLAGRSPPLGILIVHNVLHVAPRTVLIKRARQLLLSAYDVPVAETVLINWLAWTEPLKMRLEAMWQQCIRQHIGPQRLQYFFADDESRRVLVQGTIAQVRLFKEMALAIDVGLPQVRIEARIVLARADFINRVGVNAQLLLTGSGSLGLQSIGGTAQHEPWAINTGAATTTGLQLPFLFGGSSATMNALNVVLNAAENKKLVRTLLAPQVMSVSGRKAVLHEGCSVPIESYAEDAVEGRTRTLRSANYRDIGVKIQLKPLVMTDGRRVRIDVQVENSHVAATSTSTHYPTITTSKVCNTVILNDGQTVLLGGLTQKESSSDQVGVPWLSKIPFLGRLFSSAGRGQQERRLYLFLHAKLIQF